MIELIKDLTKIATPDAAEALVAFLWHPSASLRFSAAWSLAELFMQNDITEALQKFELTIEQQSADYLNWIWQPFNNSSSQSLSIIAGRIVHLLDQSSTESIPQPLPKLDPRLIIPLLSIHNPSYFRGYDIWRDKTDLLLARQELTDETKQEIIKQINEILEDSSSSNRWKIILSSLKPRLQLGLIRQLIDQRRPNISDWCNLSVDIKYQFQSSYHYRLVLVLAFIASIFSITEIILLFSRKFDHSINGFLLLTIYVLLMFWISLWRGVKEQLEPLTFIRFGLLGIWTFGTEIQRLFRNSLVWVGISSIYKSIAFVNNSVRVAGVISLTA